MSLRPRVLPRVGFLRALLPSALGLILLVALGVSSLGTPRSAAQATSTTNHDYLYLSILTGHMIKKPGWPTYVPASFSVPAHSLVTVEIINYDDGTAPPGAHSPYLSVSGVVGNSISVTPLGQQKSTQVRTLRSEQVSHTFTVPALHLNVPVPASATVTFTFRTGAAGSYTWYCMAPCGTGESGWGGAMTRLGYMRGTLTVAA